jgi:hypothetical protein
MPLCACCLCLMAISGFKTAFGQSWKKRWFRVSGADVNYLVKMVRCGLMKFAPRRSLRAVTLPLLSTALCSCFQNQDCCGELQLNRDTRISSVNAGASTRPDATEGGATVLPDKSFMVELAAASWRGHTRSFYISFERLEDQKQFVLVVQNNIRAIIDGRDAAGTGSPAQQRRDPGGRRACLARGTDMYVAIMYLRLIIMYCTNKYAVV